MLALKDIFTPDAIEGMLNISRQMILTTCYFERGNDGKFHIKKSSGTSAIFTSVYHYSHWIIIKMEMKIFLLCGNIQSCPFAFWKL